MMPPRVVPWPPRKLVADEIGRAEGVVDDQGQTVPVGDGGDGVNVRDVAVGIAQRLQVNCLGVWPDCFLHLGQVVGVHKGGGDPELGQGVGQKVIAAAVNGLLGYDMLPRLGQSLDGVSDGRRAGGQRQGRHAALQGRHALLQHVLGGIGETPVDIARVGESEPGRGLGAVAEHVGGGLIDGYRPGAGGGIGLLLTRVELEGLKAIGVVVHKKYPLSF